MSFRTQRFRGLYSGSTAFRFAEMVTMNSKRLPLLMLSLISLLIASCTDKAKLGPTLRSTREILVTSESGEKLSSMANIPFQSGKASGTVITIYPDSTKQTIHGIGTSFTESSAFVLAHLEPEQRREVMQDQAPSTHSG